MRSTPPRRSPQSRHSPLSRESGSGRASRRVYAGLRAATSSTQPAFWRSTSSTSKPSAVSDPAARAGDGRRRSDERGARRSAGSSERPGSGCGHARPGASARPDVARALLPGPRRRHPGSCRARRCRRPCRRIRPGRRGTRVADPHVDLPAYLLGSLAAELRHLGAELNAGDPDVARVERQVPSRSRGELQDLALGALADPLAVAREEQPLEAGHALVVLRRLLVEDPADPLGLARGIGHAFPPEAAGVPVDGARGASQAGAASPCPKISLRCSTASWRVRLRPSWRTSSRVSLAAQSSMIRPSSKRLITMPRSSTSRPWWVPRRVQREATLSPSVTWSSTSKRRSGKSSR